MEELEFRIDTEGLGQITWRPAPELVARYGDNLEKTLVPAAKVLEEVAQVLALRLCLSENDISYLRMWHDTIPGLTLNPDHQQALDDLRRHIERYKNDQLTHKLTRQTVPLTFVMEPF